MATRLYDIYSNKGIDAAVIVSHDKIHFTTCFVFEALKIASLCDPDTEPVAMRMSLSLFKKTPTYKQFKKEIDTYFQD